MTSDGASSIRLCLVIPVYNHEHAIGLVLRNVASSGLHCVMVDDGSSPACARVLDQLAAQHADWLTLVRLPCNQGKGGAVLAGMKEAHSQGYTHALQIDADGQHTVADIPRFIAAAQDAPTALVTGYPLYDESVPKSRLYGRYITHVWVWINTLSRRITDSMCGFRIYPLEETLAIASRTSIGKHMDFDTEIIVRLDWQGVPIINLPTRVGYPQDGVSHFHMLADNLRISRMHARLFLGMLWRLPRLLARHLPDRSRP